MRDMLTYRKPRHAIFCVLFQGKFDKCNAGVARLLDPLTVIRAHSGSRSKRLRSGAAAHGKPISGFYLYLPTRYARGARTETRTGPDARRSNLIAYTQAKQKKKETDEFTSDEMTRYVTVK